jgi:peroxiredoxin
MSLEQLPDDLPVPQDDGGADHLLSMPLPDLSLMATSGTPVNLGTLHKTSTMASGSASHATVIYIYPMTGRPDTPLPPGWNDIPGARGCTPQSCSFRDHFMELQQQNATVYGLSSQSTEYQREAKARLHLPFELLSDEQLAMKQALRLPTFTTENNELYKRLTLIAIDGIIAKVFYPVFPPGQNANDVVAWLTNK